MMPLATGAKTFDMSGKSAAPLHHPQNARWLCLARQGWLVLGGRWLIPHRVVREVASGELCDITSVRPDTGDFAFVEHAGLRRISAILRQRRDAGWLQRNDLNATHGMFALQEVAVQTGVAKAHLPESVRDRAKGRLSP